MTHELIYVFGLIRTENYIYIKFQQIEKSKKNFDVKKRDFVRAFVKIINILLIFLNFLKFLNLPFTVKKF